MDQHRAPRGARLAPRSRVLEVAPAPAYAEEEVAPEEYHVEERYAKDDAVSTYSGE